MDRRLNSTSLHRVSTVDALVFALREQVLKGTLAPGTPLREAELCATYGVSRHTVRSALQALAHDGLAHMVANRGAFVPSLTDDDVADLFRLRTMLELAAAQELADDRQSERTSGIRQTVEALAAISGHADWRELRDADLAVHQALVDALGSERSSRLFASLMTELRICYIELEPSLENQVGVARQHIEILEAIEAHDADTATQLVRAHLDAWRRDVLTGRQQTGATTE